MARPKQTEIPGTERQTNPRVEQAATSYRNIRDARMDLQRQEKPLKATLLATMRDEGLEECVLSDGAIVRVKSKENVEVWEEEPDDEVDGADDLVDEAA
jgi:deoxycytidine triphosphate deaminase